MGLNLKKPWKALRTKNKIPISEDAPEQSVKAESSSFRKKIMNVFSRKKSTRTSQAVIGPPSSQSNPDVEIVVEANERSSGFQMLPDPPSDIHDDVQKQSERVRLIMSIENVCQAVRIGDSRNEEISTVPDNLPIETKSLVDDLLFPKKNPRLCKLRTMSTDRLQSLFQGAHQRRLSGDTLVELDYQHTKIPSCLLNNSAHSSSILNETDVQSDVLTEHPSHSADRDLPELWEMNEVKLFRELPFYNASLYDSEEERIRAEVGAEWKAAFKFIGRKHHQDLVDVEEDHMDDLRRVDKRFGVEQRQGQRFKLQRDAAMGELKVVKKERDELKENLDLDTYSDENANLREDNAYLRGLIEYGREIGLEKVMGLEYQIQEHDITINAVFQQNTELQDELAEVSEEKRFLWSERAADKNALREVLEKMGPLEEELAQVKEENEEMKDKRARDNEAFDGIFQQKTELESQLAATTAENHALRLAAVGQQQDMQNSWTDGLIHLALQLLARMQSLDTELQRQGSNTYNNERATLMSYCCEVLHPLGVNVSALIANDVAQMEAAAPAAPAAFQARTTFSDL